MTLKTTRLFLVALGLAVPLVGAAGCFDPIVGARCQDGYVPCHGHCVVSSCDEPGGPDLGAPSDGVARPDGLASADAGASDVPVSGNDALGIADGASGSGGSGGAAGGASGSGGSAGSGGASGPGGSTGGVGGSSSDGGNPDGTSTTDAAVDGASAVDAAATVDAAALDVASTVDAPPPLNCGAMMQCPIVGCIDPKTDPDNCGTCGMSCGTGLCVNSVCQLVSTGHLVVIGHDYVTSRPSMDAIVGNAVFLGGGNPAVVLAYEGAAPAAAITGTDNAIKSVATSTGRTWLKTPVTAAGVPAGLAAASVFLIYAQEGTDDATLDGLGASWATSMSNFLNAGKTIVLLDGPAANSGTYRILEKAGLLHCNGRTDATFETVVAVRPGDAIATGVPQNYRGERGTVWFDTSDQTVVFEIATDAGIEPVVIHLVF